MAISVNPQTFVISVPKTDLTLLQASPELREINVNAFRLDLKDWEDDDGITFLKTHSHNTEVSLAGLTYARTVEILPPYTIEFEDGQYTVNCVGANHNLSDVKIANQVSLIVNNAAGLINNSAIEYSSFGDGVTVDLLGSFSGTVYPTGTKQRPVNNFKDALLIASVRGFGKLFVIGNATVDPALDYSNLIIIGESQTKSLLTISSNANVSNSEFEDCTITGTLDGGAKISGCRINELNYVDGFIEECILVGPISLSGAGVAHFLDCWSGVIGTGAPEIDMGGTGSGLALRNYSGNVKITNKTGAESVSIGIDSGQVVLDSTISQGLFVVTGVGEPIVNNMTGTATLNKEGYLSVNDISNAVWSEAIADLTDTTTIGGFIIGKMLTVAKFLGLK